MTREIHDWAGAGENSPSIAPTATLRTRFSRAATCGRCGTISVPVIVSAAATLFYVGAEAGVPVADGIEAVAGAGVIAHARGAGAEGRQAAVAAEAGIVHRGFRRRLRGRDAAAVHVEEGTAFAGASGEVCLREDSGRRCGVWLATDELERVVGVWGIGRGGRKDGD